MKIQATIIACVIGSLLYSAQELQIPALIPYPQQLERTAGNFFTEQQYHKLFSRS